MKRRLSVAVLILALGWLGFRLLEPIVVWKFGWEPLPAMATGEGGGVDSHFIDPEWGGLAEPAEHLLQEARSRLEAPALSAAVSIDGKRVWAGAVGLAEVEVGRPATVNSALRLGSTSKAVTAVAIGTMLDAGGLDLDLPARQYIPDLSPPLADVTTRQAMSHTAGVRNYGLCLCFPAWEQFDRRSFPDVRSALRVFESDELLFQPGEGFAYTSYGYNVAGAVLEAAAGEPFLDYLQRAVFDPLGMIHSGGEVGDRAPVDQVAFYDTEDGRFKPALRVNNSVKLPSGGLLSTPSDMVTLGNAMISDGLLSAAARELLLTPQPLADGSANPQGYALGWRVTPEGRYLGDAVTTRVIHHHGTAVGSTSYFAALPEYGLVISVMMNKGQENLDALSPEARALLELFLAEVVERRGAGGDGADRVAD